MNTIANAAPFNPVIDMQHAEAWEIILWGLCLCGAMLLVGLSVTIPRRGERKRYPIVCLAIILVIIGCAISFRDHGQAMRERKDELRRQGTEGAGQGATRESPRGAD